MNHSTTVIPVVRSLCVLIALSGCAEQGNAQSGDENAVVATRAPASPGALPDFRALVREYGDAVVNVEVQQNARQAGGQPGGQPSLPDDPFFDFFRRFGIPAPDFGPRGYTPPRFGAGSGFIISDDGYILTNAHVVAEADKVTVRLTDRREFQADVAGVDPRTDVAVIKIDAKDLPTVAIGDPDALEPGQWVLAIGSPFGLESTATAGIVSATSRAVGGESYVPFIQTDVAVNPGNSGGPLFNMQGEVVGINSMIFSRTGGYMGVSFAIPIDVAMDVQKQLVKNGRVVRGRIGVTVQDMNAQLAESFGLERPRGALVSSIDADGPAASSGLKTGDVILEVNGQTIDRFTDLSGMVAGLKPGSTAELRVWRDGKDRDVNVRVDELPNAPVRTAGGPAAAPGGKLGLAVRPLMPEERQRIDTDGAIVVDQVGSPAAESGIRPGDIILGVNGAKIESVEQFRDAVEEAPAMVALLVERGVAKIFVPVPTG